MVTEGLLIDNSPPQEISLIISLMRIQFSIEIGIILYLCIYNENTISDVKKILCYSKFFFFTTTGRAQYLYTKYVYCI